MSISASSFLNGCSNLLQSLLPGACALCGASGADAGLCAGCRADLPLLPAQHCPVCATPNSGSVCGACLAAPPAFDRVVAAYVYAFPVDAMIQALKYRGQLAFAPVLAQALSERVSLAGAAPRPELLLPMPLAAERLRERGFNQAMELARIVAGGSGGALDAAVCRRVRNTVPQALLPWKQRAANIRRAFVCDGDVAGKRVAVVDDVLTSGATMNEIAATLKRRGAVEVSAYVVARAAAR